MWFNGQGVGLGHTRLSIIDLSDGGRQPMVSASGSQVLVFNGEVYNYREIRRDLEIYGHVFHSESDSEVVLAAFMQWGVSSVTRFIGMFAIAIWDERDRVLRLFRDRLGVKPLYYSWDGRTICFGSELKALRSFTHWEPEINKESLGEYFQYGYIAAPRTIFNGVHKLLAGQMLEIADDKEPVVSQYWSVLEAEPLLDTEDELADRLEELLINAFSYRLVSDVPVGVFLSGGIDSSLVAAILQKNSGQHINTYTIGFRESQYDESGWARKIASHLGTHHNELILDISNAKDILPNWGELFDEPFGDISGVPTYLVSKMARESVKVVLSSDGGDELFGGYTNYSAIPSRWSFLYTLPLPARVLASEVLKLPVPNSVFFSNKLPRYAKLVERLHRIKYVLPSLLMESFFDQSISHWIEPDVAVLLGNNYSSPRTKLCNYKGTFGERMMLWDLHNYMPEDILTKVDRTSMAVGLEGREPLIDHRIVEFAFSLPMHMRMGTLGSKHLLRKVLYKYVPRELIDRPKQGFTVPLQKWLKIDFADLVQDYLEKDRIKSSGILNPDVVNIMTTNFLAGNGMHTNRIWLLLAFELWRDRWF
jgi:asparagine synthase (glutamine-hydrolysing)